MYVTYVCKYMHICLSTYVHMYKYYVCINIVKIGISKR